MVFAEIGNAACGNAILHNADAMPGLETRRSPSVLAGVRRNSSFGTTVTVANWSVTIGKAPISGVTVIWSGAAGAGAAGAGGGFGRGAAGRRMGLGAVTIIAGSMV